MPRLGGGTADIRTLEDGIATGGAARDQQCMSVVGGGGAARAAAGADSTLGARASGVAAPRVVVTQEQPVGVSKEVGGGDGFAYSQSTGAVGTRRARAQGRRGGGGGGGIRRSIRSADRTGEQRRCGEEGEAIVYHDVEMSEVLPMRQSIRVHEQKRADLYTLTWQGKGLMGSLRRCLGM